MAENTEYDIHTDVRFGPRTLVDIPALVEACEHPWWNQSLVTVNDSVVRLGIVKGEFHWHRHEDEDELFLVVEGRLFLDLEEETIELGPHQLYVVPKGVRHRTRAPEKVVMLMMSPLGVRPAGGAEERDPCQPGPGG